GIGSDISSLHRHRGSELVLQSEVAAHRIRGFVVELNTAQRQAVGVDQSWIKRDTTEATFQSRSVSGRCPGPRRTGSVRYGLNIASEERERVHVREVDSQVGAVTDVLESVIEHSKAATRD